MKKLTFLLFIGACAIAGCGQMGPLELPQEATSSQADSNQQATQKSYD